MIKHKLSSFVLSSFFLFVLGGEGKGERTITLSYRSLHICSGLYPTWTESYWKSISGRMFLQPSPASQHATLAIGIYSKNFIKRFMKNVSSSTFHKKDPSLRFSVCLYGNLRKFFLTHLFMNANIMNTQIFHLFRYDLNGH